MTLPADNQRRAFAKAKYIRITPRKMRLVADLIRGRAAADADNILRFTPRGASEPIRKVLKAAVSNAVNNHNLLEDSLFVSEIRVDPGPMFKRIAPRARGQAHILQKKTSHVYIAVAERAGAAAPARRARRVAAARGGEPAPAGAEQAARAAGPRPAARSKTKPAAKKPASAAGKKSPAKSKSAGKKSPARSESAGKKSPARSESAGKSRAARSAPRKASEGARKKPARKPRKAKES
jgi:large subunit ribosomal protein L22